MAPSWQHDTRYAELLSRFWNYCSYSKHYCSSSPSPQPCEGPVWRYESCLWFSNFDKVRMQMQLFKATQRTITVSHSGIVLTKAVMQIVAQLDDIRSTSIKWILYIINFLEYRMNAFVRWSWQRAGLVEGCGAWADTISLRGDSYILQTLDILLWFTKKAETDIICRDWPRTLSI